MPKGRLVFDGDNLYTEKDARIYKLKTGVSSKIDAIPWVVDSLDSTSATDALSANMGRTLQDQINAVSWIGKFLSTWDCTTWLPSTNPQEDPYTYRVWDYYIVSVVWTTNYKPHWGTFTQWVPSTTVETETVWVNDKYYFDGADWVRIPDTSIQISIDTALSTTSTNAVENRAIANAINTKQNTIADLSDIRSWAAEWATAVQPWDNISTLTNNLWYQTAWDVASAVSSAVGSAVSDTAYAASWNWVTTIAPSKNAVYDKISAMDTTIGSLSTAVSGKADATDVNTKTFYLANDQDLTTAQAAYDWYAAGKNPIIIRNEKTYVYFDKYASSIGFRSVYLHTYTSQAGGYTTPSQDYMSISFSDGVVTGINASSLQIWPYTLATNVNYSTPYTPTYDGSPATKKYVDDSISAIGISSIESDISNLQDAVAWITIPSVSITNNSAIISTTVGWLDWHTITISDNSSAATKQYIDDKISDAAFSSSWNGDTTHVPSKNAVYDVLWDIETLLANL